MKRLIQRLTRPFWRWRNSAKRKIERTPQITELEEFLVKRGVGHLSPASTWRRKGAVYYDKKLTGVRSALHTHLSYEDKTHNPYPSTADMELFIRDHEEHGLNADYIASISPTGKVVGYTILRTTPTFEHNLRTNRKLQSIIRQLTRFVKRQKNKSDAVTVSSFKRMEIPDLYPGKNHNYFFEYIFHILQGYGLRRKFKPMPGYSFENGQFMRKK